MEEKEGTVVVLIAPLVGCRMLAVLNAKRVKQAHSAMLLVKHVKIARPVNTDQANNWTVLRLQIQLCVSNAQQVSLLKTEVLNAKFVVLDRMVQAVGVKIVLLVMLEKEMISMLHNVDNVN